MFEVDLLMVDKLLGNTGKIADCALSPNQSGGAEGGHVNILKDLVNSLTTVGYLLEVFIRLWIPSMVRIFTSAWS